MIQFLLSQYIIKNNNNPNNNNQNKKGDKNKKDDNTKSEDKDDNGLGTAGTHICKATMDKDQTVAPSNSSSIGAHVSDVTKNVVPSPQCVIVFMGSDWPL